MFSIDSLDGLSRTRAMARCLSGWPAAGHRGRGARPSAQALKAFLILTLNF